MMTSLSEREHHADMHHTDTILAALHQAGTPLASHQIYALPACEGLTRAQVSSAVGHLRQQGRIRVAAARVAGPRHGPLQVPTYEPAEDVDQALIAALAASATPPAPPAPVKRTGTASRPAAAHPWQRPIVGPERAPTPPMAPPPDPDGATQEAEFCAATATAAREVEPPLATNLDTDLDTWFAIDPTESPMTETPARYTPAGHVVQAEEPRAPAPPRVTPAPPPWVAELQAWLGPLPTGLAIDKLTARWLMSDCPGELKMTISDEGGGPFITLASQSLPLDPGELAQLDRLSRALLGVFAAMAANATPIEEAPARSAGLDGHARVVDWPHGL